MTIEVKVKEDLANLVKHFDEILMEDQEVCRNIGIDLKGKTMREKWEMFLEAQAIVCSVRLGTSVNVVDFVNMLNYLATGILIERSSEEIKKYKKTGLTAKEMELILNPPEKIYYIGDCKEVKELILDNEKITLMGEKSHWNCRDKDGYEYTISVSGLDERYFLSKEMAEENIKQPR